MYFKQTKKIYFVGIGGIGTSAIAKYFLYLNKEVSGSDVYETEITKDLKKRGVKIFNQHNSGNLSEDVDLLIYSPAVPKDNPERQQAAKLGIDQLSYPEILGELSREFKTIAISGTNGKSTSTAMLGKILVAAGLDPTIIVGTQVPGFDGNLRIGKSDILVLEACEWKAHMLNLSPQIIGLTNLMEDHLDFYKDINDIIYYFQKFINSLPITDGLLAYNKDDSNIKKLTINKGYKTKTWSLESKSDFQASNIKLSAGKQTFNLGNQEYLLKIPGQYNIYNALTAISIAKHFNIPDEVIKNALADFKGSWRRFEILGPVKKIKDTKVITDYAHHPDALTKVIAAAKDFYPDKRIVVAFQPHHYDRTAKLFNGFIKSFNDADFLILNEIYDVAGRQQDGARTVSSKDLVKAIQKISPSKEVIYSVNLKETKKLILKNLKKGDLLLIIGAGDIDTVAREIVK